MKHCIVIIACFISLSLNAQMNVTHWSYDFGSGKAASGSMPVLPADEYSDAKGYGFERGADLEAVNRGGSDLMRREFITSKKPFLFSVQVPEGNYSVSVLVGNKTGESDITIRAECRRVMVQRVRLEKGKFATLSFNVHIHDSLIKGTDHKVRLKSREINYYHWDNKLTLEFNGTQPNVCAVHIEPVKNITTVFLAGNSTVVDQAEEPYAAWGQILPAFFDRRVVVANYAESGEALNSFRSARRLEKVLSLMKPGDYLFIEFGHNDQKQKGEGVGPFTTYKRDLKYYISEVRKKGGIPVLVTSMNRRSFDSTGHIVNTLGDYPAAVRQTAAEENVALIDLNNMSKTLYEAWGPDKSESAFVIYPANTFPGQDKELKDNTHFNPYGAYEIARCIAKGITDNKLGIAQYLKKEYQAFNPAQPDDLNKWYWPLSPRQNVTKPDGN